MESSMVRSSGRCPKESSMSGFAPRKSRVSQAARRLKAAARCRGVRPRRSLKLTRVLGCAES
jgi:hypothetical protein